MTYTVNKAEFSAIIGKSARVVGRYIDKGMPIEKGIRKATDGKGAVLLIDTVKAIDWLMARHLQKQTGKCQIGSVEANTTKEAEEIRLLKAKADKQEVDNAERAKELIHIEDFERINGEIAQVYSSQLDAVASRLCSHFPEPATARQHILSECRRIRNQTADALLDYTDALNRERERLRATDSCEPAQNST